MGLFLQFNNTLVVTNVIAVDSLLLITFVELFVLQKTNVYFCKK